MKQVACFPRGEVPPEKQVACFPSSDPACPPACPTSRSQDVAQILVWTDWLGYSTSEERILLKRSCRSMQCELLGSCARSSVHWPSRQCLDHISRIRADRSQGVSWADLCGCLVLPSGIHGSFGNLMGT